MRKKVETTTSVWTDARLPDLELLHGHQSCEVCVIGAGIAGLTTAYTLSGMGKSVIVVEDGSVGGGETCRTTAHLASALDDRYFQLEKIRGKQIAKLAAQSHSAAITRIESIVNSEGIDCDFQRLDGFLFNPPKRSVRPLKRELEAAHRAGLTDVELLDRAPVSSFDTGPCLRFPRQGQFHPMKYLSGLVEAIRRNGGTLYTGAHVTARAGRQSRACGNTSGTHRFGASRYRCDQQSDYGRRFDSYQAVSLSHLCDRCDCSSGFRPWRAVLGHSGSLSLHPAAE